MSALIPRLTTSQIGRSGELLVQSRLLRFAIDTGPMSTDTGIDLVAYSPRAIRPVTIQVKSNDKPKPSGGKGRLALDWWVPEASPADFHALVDLSIFRVWIFSAAEFSQYAQQTSNGRHHLYMYVDDSIGSRTRVKPVLVSDFTDFLLENCWNKLLGAAQIRHYEQATQA